jgi:glycine cleavage system H protein
MSQLIEMFWIAFSFAGGVAARLGFLALAALGAATLATLGVLAVRGLNAARLRALGVTRVGGLRWHPDVLFAPQHTWLRRTGGETVQLGVDDLAQRICVGAEEITLPAPGTRLHAGDVAATIRSGNRVVSIATPVDGTVLRTNRSAQRDPSVVKREPYHRGWLLSLSAGTLPFAELRSGESSRRWMRAEEQRLNGFLERELAVAAADGGEFILPAPSLLSDTQWKALTEAFLQP